MANLLDKLVGWVNPRAGLLRHHHRVQLKRAYEAAAPRDPWKPSRPTASANADHMADASKIRAKARALVQNVPYIAAGLEAKVAALISTGITPRATGAQAEKINATLAVWFKECDADGRLDFFGMQAVAARAMEQDGEVLIRLRPRRPADGLAIPLQLQLLEIDWLDSTRMGAFGGNDVVNGIEYDPLGRVAAYYLWDYHPGDVNVRRNVKTQSRRVDARNIIHVFDPKRASQGRGFSSLAPVISRVRDLQLYEDSELARKNLESRLGVYVSPDPTVFSNPAADGQANTPSKIQETGSLGELGSGQIMTVPIGTTITTVEPKPVGGFDSYVKLNHHVIAAGFGITYEMLTGDVSEVNFSSVRARMLDFRRGIDAQRWLIIIPRMLEPIYRAAIDAGELAGLWRRDYAVDYAVPKWDYVNPQQDVEADIKECSVGLSSISEKLRNRGYKPDEVFAEIAKERELFEKLGIDDWLLFKEKGKLPGDAQAAAEAQADSDAKAEKRATQRQDELDQSRRIDAIATRELVRAIADKPHTVTVAPAQVNIAPAEVRVEPTTINVAAPSVHVDGPTIHVEPAPEVSRTVEKDVRREDGLISKITERITIN